MSFASGVPSAFEQGPSAEVQVDGYCLAAARTCSVSGAQIGSGYFDVMRIRLIEGRDFTERDEANRRPW